LFHVYSKITRFQNNKTEIHRNSIIFAILTQSMSFVATDGTVFALSQIYKYFKPPTEFSVTSTDSIKVPFGSETIRSMLKVSIRWSFSE
jgi:hypothetical protein